MSIDLPTLFFTTYRVLLTPPHPLSDSSLTDSSPFAEANLAVNDLIWAMKNKTNEMQTSDPAELPSTTKSAKIAFPTFRGKPLAMALYQQNRKKVARVPGQLEVKKRISRKPPTVPPVRDSKGKFSHLNSTDPAIPTESFSMDTTQTPGSSEQVSSIMTELVSPSPPDPEPISQTLRYFDCRSWRANQNSGSCVGCRLSSTYWTYFSYANTRWTRFIHLHYFNYT